MIERAHDSDFGRAGLAATELVRRCDDVVVSLDGPRPVHNQIRNIPRAYERLVELGPARYAHPAGRAGP